MNTLQHTVHPALRLFPLKLLRIFLFASLPPVWSANLIVNGGFESNSASSTRYNLTNAELSAMVDGVTAFGSASEIDIITTGNVAYPDPLEGDWSLALNNYLGLSIDAFSFSLLSPLAVGFQYQLDFRAVCGTPNPATVLVGISNSATDFGQQIYATPILEETPGLYSFTFVATAPASYLTVMPDLHVVIVDDFLLRGVPEPSSYALMGILVFAAAMQRRRPA